MLFTNNYKGQNNGKIFIVSRLDSRPQHLQLRSPPDQMMVSTSFQNLINDKKCGIGCGYLVLKIWHYIDQKPKSKKLSYQSRLQLKMTSNMKNESISMNPSRFLYRYLGSSSNESNHSIDFPLCRKQSDSEKNYSANLDSQKAL